MLKDKVAILQNSHSIKLFNKPNDAHVAELIQLKIFF